MSARVPIMVIALFTAASAWAHSATSAGVGVEQRLGSFVPLSTFFIAEDGSRVGLRSLVTAPTILAMVYYRCPNACDFLLSGIANTLASLDAVPGRDYNVVTISVDPAEGPADARKAQRLSLETIEKPFPAASWRFLTGREPSIRAVAQSIGFQYRRNEDGFDHPLAIVILSPDGKVVRYMMGAEFLPADLKLALLEAQTGTIGPTIARLARICFRVDPTSHKLVFKTMSIVATVTLACAAAFIAFLLVSGYRRKHHASQ